MKNLNPEILLHVQNWKLGMSYDFRIGRIYLTKTQHIVMRLRASNCSMKQIADYLGTSERTINKHLGAIHSITNTHTMVALTHWAILNSLVTVGEYID